MPKAISVKKPKPTPILEKTRQKNILKYLNAVPGCIAEPRTQTGYGKKGGADIFGCYNGRHFELEVKQPGAKMTLLQKQWLQRWHQVGAIAGCVYDVETTRDIFANYGEENI